MRQKKKKIQHILVIFKFHENCNGISVENRIPLGTSPELSNLLMGLLKRNAADRISFEDYFNHPFMNNKPQTQPSQATIEQPTFMVGDSFTPPKTPSPIQMKTLGKH